MNEEAKAAHLRWVKASVAMAIAVDGIGPLTVETRGLIDVISAELTEASLAFGRAMMVTIAQTRGPAS